MIWNRTEPLYEIPLELLICFLPGAVLLGVYWAAIRMAQSGRGRMIELVFGYLLLALGAYSAACWYRYHGYGSWLLVSGCLTPGALIVAAGHFCRAKGERVRAVIPVSVTLALLIALISSLGYLFSWGISPVMTTASYGSILESGKNLTSHFPREIPNSAKNVRLYYSPRFLQGGSHFEIRYETSPAELEALVKKYGAKALAVYDGSPDLFHYANETKGYPTAEFRDESNTGQAPLPSDFKVMVLESKPPADVSGNHDYSSGIAVSMKRLEVIYWADRW
jgi:hypothetical protein